LAVIGKDYHVVWANKQLMNLVLFQKKIYQIFNRSEKICSDWSKNIEQNVSFDIHEFETVDSGKKVGLK
jgi:hypothetical protein